MNKDEYYWSRLQQYAEGKLSEKEIAEIKAWIQTEEEAQIVVKGFQEIMDEIPEEEVRAHYYKEQIRNTVERVQTSQKISPFQYLTAASILLIGFAIVYFILQRETTQPSLEELLADYSAEFYSARFDDRGNTSSSPDWVDAYEDKDFSTVIEILMTKSDANDTRESFYLGMAFFYMNNFPESVERFRSISPKSSLYTEQSQWFLALSLIQVGSTAEAVTILHQITQEKTYKSSQAEKLLEHLKPL